MLIYLSLKCEDNIVLRVYFDEFYNEFFLFLNDEILTIFQVFWIFHILLE
jgi:hypothetical protein